LRAEEARFRTVLIDTVSRSAISAALILDASSSWTTLSESLRCLSFSLSSWRERVSLTMIRVVLGA
jgi:hypothetical protein